jgi:hypothetical protein
VLDGAFQLGFRHLRTAPDAPTAGFVVELLLRAPPRGDTQPSRDQITIRLVLLLIGVIPGTVVGRDGSRLAVPVQLWLLWTIDNYAPTQEL